MTRNIISQSAWIVTLVVIASTLGKATLNIKPTDAAVLLNGSTFFNCSTFNFRSSSEEIVWYHYSVSSDKRQDVYEDGDILSDFESRFRVEKDLSKGIVNLILEAPTLEDAGTYECQDGKGFGEASRAQLTVIETEPVCQSNIQPDGVIGSNDCGIPPDQLEMSCSITYRGNNPVQLEWRNSLENEKSSMTVKCSNTTTRSTCNLNVTGDHARNNSVYICQTKNTRARVYSCSSDVIRILYVMSDNKTISTTDEEGIRCSANSSQNCSYNWYSEGKMVSDSDMLKATTRGQYVCKANCSIRGQTCLVTARNLNFSDETTNEDTSKAGLNAGAIVAIVLVIVAIFSTITFVVWYCQHKRNKPPPNDDKAQIPLQSATDKNGGIPTNDFETQRMQAIQRALNPNLDHHLGAGLGGGEICGPMEYIHQGIQCAFLQIKCLKDQTAAGGTSKQDSVCRKGEDWMALKHKNLVEFYDVVKYQSSVVIVMEYVEGGSVRKAMEKCENSGICLPMRVIKDWATQIAMGMDYLHRNDITYGCLNCDQILIKELFQATDVSNKTLKIVQFRLTDYKCMTTAGQESLSFLAPESPEVSKKRSAPESSEVCKEQVLEKESDVWSFGIVIWAILTRKQPYSDFTGLGYMLDDICNNASHLTILDCWCDELKDILKGCRKASASDRPSFGDIVAHLNAWEIPEQ